MIVVWLAGTCFWKGKGVTDVGHCGGRNGLAVFAPRAEWLAICLYICESSP
jgi:hypothetical protein